MRIRNKKGNRKNTCSKCNSVIENSRKNCRYCRECHKAYQRKNRKKYSEFSEDQKLKSNARAYANVYISRGKIKRCPCEVCDNTAQMHHEDYSEPLKIKWLCRKHHMDHHKIMLA